MKIYLNSFLILELKEPHLEVFKIQFPEQNLNKILIEWIQNLILSKYKESLNSLKKEWIPKLKERNLPLPVNEEDLLELILLEGNYNPKN